MAHDDSSDARSQAPRRCPLLLFRRVSREYTKEVTMDTRNYAMRTLMSLACCSLFAGAAAAHDGDRLGTVDFPISCTAEAQAAFNRAVAMLHNFWFPQAGNAFAEVVKTDPTCAMAYWGVAISARANPLVGAPAALVMKRGWEFVEKAKAAGAKTQRERDYIAALELYYKNPDDPIHQPRVLAFEKAMEALSQRYPDDVEAALLYALALNESIISLPADKTYSRHMKAARIAENVLAKHPDHPGALHYLIHSYDFPALADRGVKAAKIYGSVAPGAPHALHMPSHIYSMLGMWEESIESNINAVEAAKGYVHAIDFMVYAHLQLGQDGEAKRLLDTAAGLQKSAGGLDQRSPTGALLSVHTAYAAIPARYAIERGAWKEASALPLLPTSPPADAITHFTRAIGFARLRNTASARKEIESLRALCEELMRVKDVYWAQQVDTQRVAALAWLALAEGRSADAVNQMHLAADMEDASEKHVAMENRLWPMRELLGDLLLELGEPGAALEQFEASLADSRNRLRGYYGAAKAAAAAGNHGKAAEYYRKVLALTKHADPGRIEAQQAKAYLAAR
jgi:tetratricopeptide (TPR) repeat protein